MADKTVKEQPFDDRSFVRVTVERTVTQQRDIGVLVEDKNTAGEEVLKLEKIHRDAGWRTVEIGKPKIKGSAHVPGVFNRANGRTIAAR